LTNQSNYDFRVSAININGTGTPSSFITLMPFTTVELWLKADSGTNCNTSGCNISLWNDNSSKNMHATGYNNPTLTTTSPLYNFNNAVNFDGSGTSGTPTAAYFGIRSGFSNFTSGFAAYIIARPTANKSYGRFIDFSNGAGVDNIAFGRTSTQDSLMYFIW
jgi:hypothetical protein